MTGLISKVKAALIGAGLAAAIAGVTAIIQYASTFDWEGLGIFGPGVGLAVGAALAAALAFLKRSSTEDIGKVAKSSPLPDDEAVVVDGTGAESAPAPAEEVGAPS